MKYVIGVFGILICTNVQLLQVINNFAPFKFKYSIENEKKHRFYS